MKNEIKIFNNPQFGNVRATTNENNEPLFCAIDVARILEYANPAKAVIDHCKGVTVLETPTTNQWGAEVMQNIKFIKEPDMYRLVMKSKAPGAEKFQDWVCEEVLPSIRETGGYIVSKPEDTDADLMARALLVAQATIEKKDRQIEQVQKEVREKILLLDNANETIIRQAPKVYYYDNVLMSADTMTTTQVAKSIGRSCRWLNTKLKECGLIYYQSGQWMLKSPYDSWNLHKVRTATFTHTDGTTATKTSTVWNERGRRFIVALSQCDFKIKSAVKLIQGELQSFPA